MFWLQMCVYFLYVRRDYMVHFFFERTECRNRELVFVVFFLKKLLCGIMEIYYYDSSYLFFWYQIRGLMWRGTFPFLPLSLSQCCLCLHHRFASLGSIPFNLLSRFCLVWRGVVVYYNCPSFVPFSSELVSVLNVRSNFFSFGGGSVLKISSFSGDDKLNVGRDNNGQWGVLKISRSATTHTPFWWS